MDSWNYRPARDFELSPVERARSLKREPGVWSGLAHLTWHSLAKSYLKIYHRLRVEGTEHLPAEPPFILIANHSSHLDAIVLGSALSAASVQQCVSRLPRAMSSSRPRPCRSSRPRSSTRYPCGGRTAAHTPWPSSKSGSSKSPAATSSFPKAARSRDGSLKPFKAGLGMIVAGTSVPVVPCWITGAWQPGTPKRAGPGRGKSGSRSARLCCLTGFQTPAQAGSKLLARPRRRSAGWGAVAVCKLGMNDCAR